MMYHTKMLKNCSKLCVTASCHVKEKCQQTSALENVANVKKYYRRVQFYETFCYLDMISLSPVMTFNVQLLGSFA